MKGSKGQNWSVRLIIAAWGIPGRKPENIQHAVTKVHCSRSVIWSVCCLDAARQQVRFFKFSTTRAWVHRRARLSGLANDSGWLHRSDLILHAAEINDIWFVKWWHTHTRHNGRPQCVCVWLWLCSPLIHFYLWDTGNCPWLFCAMQYRSYRGTYHPHFCIWPNLIPTSVFHSLSACSLLVPSLRVLHPVTKRNPSMSFI